MFAKIRLLEDKITVSAISSLSAHKLTDEPANTFLYFADNLSKEQIEKVKKIHDPDDNYVFIESINQRYNGTFICRKKEAKILVRLLSDDHIFDFIKNSLKQGY